MLGSAAVEFICIFKSIKLEGIKQWYKNADKVKKNLIFLYPQISLSIIPAIAVY